jgi:hypothetical protein
MYYLEVISNGLSLCIDSDTGYYHYFKTGDIITAEFIDKSLRLSVDGILTYETLFIKDDLRLRILDCIRKGLLADITINTIRDKKLNKLGI